MVMQVYFGHNYPTCASRGCVISLVAHACYRLMAGSYGDYLENELYFYYFVFCSGVGLKINLLYLKIINTTMH